jgi:hypothetical protein
MDLLQVMTYQTEYLSIQSKVDMSIAQSISHKTKTSRPEKMTTADLPSLGYV